ncbi:MAG: 50S ribosomal protein L24 [Bacteroidetes bacterium]|nr:MAG: 50S ribosomal protein L24 [Bacteroidota bacterium]
MAKLHIKKGDTVLVISGNDRGKQGRVLDIDTEKKRAIVEGVNMVKKHTRPNADNPKGGIIESESAVHISNLKVVDAKGNATRVGRKTDEKTGKTVRYSKKSGEVIK